MFKNEIKALILMSSLPESWYTVVAAINSSWGSDKLKFDEIRDVVLSESIANGKLEIHQAMLSVLIESKDVNQRAQTNMGDQNQGIEKNLLTNQTWRKMTLSDIWYKIEEKQNHKFEDR